MFQTLSGFHNVGFTLHLTPVISVLQTPDSHSSSVLTAGGQGYRGRGAILPHWCMGVPSSGPPASYLTSSR